MLGGSLDTNSGSQATGYGGHRERKSRSGSPHELLHVKVTRKEQTPLPAQVLKGKSRHYNDLLRFYNDFLRILHWKFGLPRTSWGLLRPPRTS